MNHLANESSLYLRQHAGNPVDWYPWGDEAIARARGLDRPIFLSVGYSACHWCHVMEHESFQDEATAHFLNEHFIPVKVDREERPDIDHLYMTALQVMTREGGGWPLSVWLTPDLHPFYAGTYFPPDDRYAPQRPSFRRLLAAIAEAWRERRAEIIAQSGNVAGFLRDMTGTASAGTESLSPEMPEAAARAIARGFDPVNGGFGTAPKFPHALELLFLLRRWAHARDESILHIVRHSLDRMAAGGIYDQIGGGFHRYSTDARWLVPHFEKMLYDNALLVPLYAEAWQATGDAEYRRIAEETLEYVLREMTSPPGAFYSTQDADSEGEEGKFYVWTPAEIEAILGPEEAQFVGYVYGVSEEGNFEGKNILHRAKTWEQLEKMLKSPADTIRARLKSAGAKLYEARSKRVWPGRDEKVLVSWNGLMITAFARAGAAFGEPRFTAGAAKAADFILANMVAVDATLFRTCAVGAPPRIPGYLEDYACFTDALVELYQATFENRWLEAALRLADGLVARFADPAGGFFSTADDHKHLIARAKDSYDGSTPSGNSMAITALLKLAKLTDRADLRERAESALRSFGPFMAESPGGAAQMLSALDFHFGPVTEIVVIGRRGAEDTRRVLAALRARCAPNQLLVFHDPSAGPADEKLLPLLQGRTGGTEVTTYVCENQTCSAPMKGAAAVVEWLGQKEG
jgi:uncharacterized protein YyaL (SSP411 family)